MEDEHRWQRQHAPRRAGLRIRQWFSVSVPKRKEANLSHMPMGAVSVIKSTHTQIYKSATHYTKYAHKTHNDSCTHLIRGAQRRIASPIPRAPRTLPLPAPSPPPFFIRCLCYHTIRQWGRGGVPILGVLGALLCIQWRQEVERRRLK